MSESQWDQRFSGDGFVYGTKVNQFVGEHAEVLPERARVACFAEGEGRNAVYLAGRGHEVTAYDQSQVGLDKMVELAARHGVEVTPVQLDLTKERAGEAEHDAAVMVFGHVPKEGQSFLIENMLNAVKPGGVIMLEVYSEEQLEYGTGGPPSCDLLYDPADMLGWLKKWKMLHFYYGEAVRHEGDRHTGLGHVIQVVAEKP
ncbi:bifunctional 2-polyprenyl-6-hydroxyphenol methylase/3-demethylubiquinol 3-O-methyltransferase UbiG [Halobacillus sp. A5]|uniref:class I SAM-dependent methyltransferase n=1 Tax=Halobacillus sp. A5 TaxID=2880263 RepID=UPI0020A6C5B6|nr:class I SAM-dependent methyltransferase [Halobacillus sp. A5]MCP3027167.1 class I SAM-dependent methyltransferase [Halobacillus sp. A5]